MGNSYSVSLRQGKGSLRHNNRDFIADNVDPDRTKDNIIVKQESLETAYEKCFGESIENYNEKQKRKDRRIDGVKGYMDKIETSGNGEKVFYELVGQIGNMTDCPVGSARAELATKILKAYIESFQARNPHLYVFNAVIHLDEATPHFHLDYIPVAEGYSKGMEKRNSLDKALACQGVKPVKTDKTFISRTQVWQEQEKDYIEKLMAAYSLERKPESGLHRKNLTVDQYKTCAQIIEQDVEALPDMIDSKPIPLSKDRVSVSKADLERLERRAKLSVIHEDATKKASEAIVDDLASARVYKSYAKLKGELADSYRKDAKEELEEVRESKEKYESLYAEQKELNESYEQVLKENGQLKGEISDKQDTIDWLRAKNSSLSSQLTDSEKSAEEAVEKAVQEATEPLRAKIRTLESRVEDLKERLHGMCQSIANVVKATRMLQYSDEYKVALSPKQNRLIEAIAKYTTHWLRNEGKEAIAEDVEKRIGISTGIQAKITELTPKRTYDRGR